MGKKPERPRRGLAVRSHAAKPRAVGKSPEPREAGLGVEHVKLARELFWQNVIREFLGELAAMGAELAQREGASSGAGSGASSGASLGAGAGDPALDPSMFDGRLAVVTTLGERIPIAGVMPLLSAGARDPAQRGVAMAVDASVFQIRTPDGHVFTLPLHHIHAIHALTPELLAQLEKQVRSSRRARRGEGAEEKDDVPFGFAAFTSVARGLSPEQGWPREASPAPAE